MCIGISKNKSPLCAPLLLIFPFLDKCANIRRVDLLEILLNKGPLRPRDSDSQQLLINSVLRLTGGDNGESSNLSTITKVIDAFTKSLCNKWAKCHRYLPKFKKIYESWLLEDIFISKVKKEVLRHTDTPSTSNMAMGRPKVSFAEGSRQTKRRRIQGDVSMKSEEELCLAAEMKLHLNGKRNVANMFRKLRSSPKSAKRLKHLEVKTKTQTNEVSFSADEALAFFISFKLTRHQYLGLRALVSKKGLNRLFPTYDKIIEAKKNCYPSDVTVTDMSAEVPLQSLLDHTTRRILESQKDVLLSTFETVPDTTTLEIPLKFIYKWGSDGSGNQSRYKQKCVGDDSNILTTSIVPLQLSYDNKKDKNVLVWQNPRTSSTRFCRPIRIQFLKETNEVIKSEFSNIESQINELLPSKISVFDKNFVVNYQMLRTMVDGKVCNSLMSSSSQKCYLCNAGPTHFNNLEYIKSLSSNTSAYSFGLSTLHAYIRFFECFLHISYRLDLKVWRVPQIHKAEMQKRKDAVIEKFREETGLLIDIPKVNLGNTNDGNTARKFFSDPVLTSNITGLDQNLLYRCSVILKTLNSNYHIDSIKFDQYAYETAVLYVQLYGWYPMPPTVHKIFMHSKEVIEHFLIPIGQLSEDAQESRHKEIKYYREHNTRKISRKHLNEDLLNILLVSSDPLISSLRVLPPRKESVLNEDVMNLLKAHL